MAGPRRRARVGAHPEHHRRDGHVRRRLRRGRLAAGLPPDAPVPARPGGGRMSSLPGRPTNDATLADILERVLDKGIVIAGDIQVNLLDIELLTIKLRLLIASVDKAKEMGIDWWEVHPALSSRAQ